MAPLSIIIVTYNSAAHIDACLKSMARHPPAIDHEIVVVDNASHDGTSSLVRQRHPSVRVVDSGRNLGFAKACNIGFRQTSGELVLLLNPDTEMQSGAMDRLIAGLTATPAAAVAGPRLIDANGRAELSFGSMISPLSELRQKILVRGHEGRVPMIERYVEALTRRAQEVDWVSGACLLVRRSDAESVGLMDERFFVYTEDVDFCASIRARGRKVLFVPQAAVVHVRGQSVATDRGAASRAYRASQIAFYEKHHPRWAPLLRLYLKIRGKTADTPITGG